MFGLNHVFYKTLEMLFMPLGLAIGGFTLAFFLLIYGSKNKSKITLIITCCWLWIWSTPIFCHILNTRLESQFKYRPATTYGKANAIVVLGGGVRGSINSMYPSIDLNGSADRELFASELFFAGKAKVIIVAGGNDPMTGAGIASLAMKNFLIKLGVPENAIRLEASSKNTMENAREVLRMMNNISGDSIILVTSALHMPRAMWIFSLTKLHIVPAPTDFEVVPFKFKLSHILPDAGALETNTRAFKEIVGLLVYKAQYK